MIRIKAIPLQRVKRYLSLMAKDGTLYIKGTIYKPYPLIFKIRNHRLRGKGVRIIN